MVALLNSRDVLFLLLSGDFNIHPLSATLVYFSFLRVHCPRFLLQGMEMIFPFYLGVCNTCQYLFMRWMDECRIETRSHKEGWEISNI